MHAQQTHNQSGVTLIELLVSIVAASILMLAITSLMNITHREWGKGSEVQSLSAEMAFTLDVLSREIRTTSIDSVGTSLWGDTLKIGDGTRVYKDANDNLVLKRGSVVLPFLEKSVRAFSVESPIITQTGDTLNSVAVTIVAEKEFAKDSTVVWLTPRVN